MRVCLFFVFCFFIFCFVNILFVQESYNWVVSCWCCNHKLDPGGGTPGNSWWGCAARFSRPERLKSVIFHTLFHTWGPFLERPGNFSGPKSNIQIEIKRIRARVLARKLLHFVSLTGSFIMLDAKLLKPLSWM